MIINNDDDNNNNNGINNNDNINNKEKNIFKPQSYLCTGVRFIYIYFFLPHFIINSFIVFCLSIQVRSKKLNIYLFRTRKSTSIKRQS